MKRSVHRGCGAVLMAGGGAAPPICGARPGAVLRAGPGRRLQLGRLLCRPQRRLRVGQGQQQSPPIRRGIAGGIQVGYNWQSGQFVFGGETDLQLSGADDTFAP